MNATLITFGRGLPRYEREVICNIDPAVFVQLKAQAAAKGLDSGEVYAVLIVGKEIFEATAEASAIEVFGGGL